MYPFIRLPSRNWWVETELTKEREKMKILFIPSADALRMKDELDWRTIHTYCPRGSDYLFYSNKSVWCWCVLVCLGAWKQMHHENCQRKIVLIFPVIIFVCHCCGLFASFDTFRQRNWRCIDVHCDRSCCLRLRQWWATHIPSIPFEWKMWNNGHCCGFSFLSQKKKKEKRKINGYAVRYRCSKTVSEICLVIMRHQTWMQRDKFEEITNATYEQQNRIERNPCMHALSRHIDTFGLTEW